MTLKSFEINEVETRLQPSPTLAAADAVRRLKLDGKPVFRFDLGEPDFDTPKHVKEAAIDAIRRGYTHYTSAKGLPELREAIANKYAAKGVPVKPDNVAVFPGSKFALYSVLSLLTAPGDEVIVQDPSWPSYASMVTFLHGSPIFVPATLEQHFVPEIQSFQEKVTDRTRAVIMNSPGNPTGAVYPPPLVKDLRELCEERRSVLISDEIYSALVYDGQASSPLEDPESGNTIVVSGFSKEFAMTGWRLGYTLASKRVTDLLVRFLENTVTCPTSFVQKAAVAALEGPRDWFREMLAEYRTRRDAMIEGLAKIPGCQYVIPEGAFYCFPRINFKDSRALVRMLLQKERVSVVAGAYFGPSGERHIRLSFTCSLDNVREGMERIRRFAELHGGQF